MKRMKVGRAWPLGRVLLTMAMLVTVAVTLGGPTAALGHEPTLSVDPAMEKGYLGETFTVSVDIEDAEDVVGYQFFLDYDPAVLSLSNPTDGGFLSSAPSCTIGGGTAACTALDTPPYNGGADSPGTLVTFDAEVVGAGMTALALRNAQVSDVDAETVEPNLEDGLVDAVVALEVVPSSGGRSVNMGTFTETVMIHNASDLAGFQFDMAFDPDVVQVQDVELTPFLESEGRTAHAGLMQKLIDNDAGTLFFAAGTLPPGDGPNGDGALAVITLDAVAKGDTALDLQDSKVYDTAAVEQMPVNLDGMIHVVDEGIQVVPMHTEVFEGEPFSVTVQVGDAQDLAGFEFNLGFDETLVNVTDVELGPFLSDAVTTTEVIDNDAGTLFFGAFALAGQTADVGTLATIHMTALEVDADATSDLDLFAPVFYNSGGDPTVPTDTDGDVLVKNCIPVTIDDFVSDTPVVLGETMNFTATVSGTEPISYDWDFGGDGELVGGGEDTGAFVYDAAGPYTVTLTAENCGDVVTETLVVDVCDPVTIDEFVSDSPVVLGETMNFTATVSGTEPISYAWDFGGEGELVGGGEETGAFVYDAAGTYTVTLTATNCGGAATDEASMMVEVTEPVYQIFMPIIAKNFTP